MATCSYIAMVALLTHRSSSCLIYFPTPSILLHSIKYISITFTHLSLSFKEIPVVPLEGMAQIKYILYSVLILMGAALTYAVMKPMVQSQWIKVESPEPIYNGNTENPEPVIRTTGGKKTFLANCATCHAIQKNLTGPALAGVEERGPWTKRENLVKWISNPASFIPTTAYTKELTSQYNGQIMPSFPQLSKEEIYQILDYIKEASVHQSY